MKKQFFIIALTLISTCSFGQKKMNEKDLPKIGQGSGVNDTKKDTTVKQKVYTNSEKSISVNDIVEYSKWLSENVVYSKYVTLSANDVLTLLVQWSANGKK